MKQKAILIIALLALVSMMIAPVMAESLTGTIGGDSVNSQSYSLTPWAYQGYFSSITVNGSEYIPPAFILVRFDDGTIPNYASQGLPRAPSGNTTSVYICYSTEPCTQLNNRGHGTIGYQRNFDNAFPTSNEIDGFQWIDITDFNSTGVTGFNKFNLIFDFELNTVYVPTFISPESIPPAGISFGGSPGGSASGNYLLNTVLSFANDYSATKPAGIGIMGVLIKDNGACIPNCPSRGFIYDGITGALITSDSTVSAVDLSFSTISETIIIGATDSNMIHFNSSVLFTVAPIPTPTVTPTPTTTIPAGYVRNNLFIWDQNDAQIVGADVDVLDVEAGTWTNTTADPDGWITIDTLPYHTVNIYAHYTTANIYLPNEILGLETGYYGGHNWVIVLYPYTTTPAGFVTLYINTRNYDTKAVLTGVNLQIKNLVTGATTGESTGSTDSVTTVVTNATNYQITGSKSGYLSKTININSGEASSKTVVVELSRSTVTPTVTATIIPGETTVRPTYSPGCDPSSYDAGACSSGKDLAMMDQVRDAGPMLIGLAILATVFGLLKLIAKK